MIHLSHGRAFGYDSFSVGKANNHTWFLRVWFSFMKLLEAINEFGNWRQFQVTGFTVQRYDKALRIFCLAFHNQDIESITIDQVMNYLNSMQRLGWARNGVAVVCLALRKFFEFFNLRQFDVLDYRLIPLPRKEYKIPRIADEKNYRKLLNSIPIDKHPNHVRNRALIGMIWDSGARSGEICSINASDLDLVERRCVIRTEKSRGRRPIREIFWTSSTNLILKRWLEKRSHLGKTMQFKDPEALFLTISKFKQSQIRGARMNPRNVAEVLRVLSNKAGIPVMNAHSMRHHFGRSIVEAGGSNSDVSNLLGHSNIESSMIYTLMTGPRLKQRYEIFRGRRRRRFSRWA